jgi:hypothetical protein
MVSTGEGRSHSSLEEEDLGDLWWRRFMVIIGEKGS